MILYNVTLKVDPQIDADWMAWMRSIHIRDVMMTGLFSGYRMSRILHLDDSDGNTYTIQYELENRKKLEAYQSQFAKSLQKDHADRYGDKVLAFRSVMEILDEGKAP